MELQAFAKEIRYYTLKELNNIGYGHYGGALSIVETLAVLYGKYMKVNPLDPKDTNRDYFVLSKGHAGPAYYATLALKGFFPLEKLMTLNANGTRLPSHPDKNLVEGVDMTTGSLGQGISVATGISYYLKSKNKPNRVYTIVGDGELNEGQCWEAVQFAAHHQLSNLTIFVDDNKKQLDGYTNDICKTFDFVEKFKAFGLNAISCDGSDVDSIDAAIQLAHNHKETATVIILQTTKGQGVPLVENTMDNHHIRWTQEEKEKMDEFTIELEKEMA